MSDTQQHFNIKWDDAGREPKAKPNPDYPDGIDLDATKGGAESCIALLPYPAKRCGTYIVECNLCGMRLAITTAGRPDDPRSVKIACKLNGGGTAQ